MKKSGVALDVQTVRICVLPELWYPGTLRDLGGEDQNPALLSSLTVIQPIPGAHKPSTSKTS